MKINNLLVIAFILILNACQKKENIDIAVYKDGNSINTFSGIFYTTKYGGINYFIPNDNQREKFFSIDNIDSISILVGKQKYISKPLINRAFSREKNNSDFSFYVDEKEHKVVINAIDDMDTFLLFSEKTNMEKLKENGTIKATYLESIK
ncbi:hypothetical protein MH928_02755 [Flavobacterium sp. WW92]|uniref:hypothetical protein n=1 Tax=unclassified Flavobacterium TaxID=196869 RepID=UPI0022247489|nr:MULTISPECIES: hypothetical protein [unclassified Flavobacterium]WDO13630.1 hypothetical protein MH928_02755 [Flavobacterium sp. WW92]